MFVIKEMESHFVNYVTTKTWLFHSNLVVEVHLNERLNFIIICLNLLHVTSAGVSPSKHNKRSLTSVV